MAQVAFLGIGAMGSRMAAVLLKAGHDVMAWNRSTGKLRPLVAAGATAAPTPKAAVASADFVVAMVRDDAASRHVWLDATDGALAALRQGTVAIESSTLSADWVRELAGRFEASSARFLEAPVSGTLPQAEMGQLVHFVGGDAGTIAEARPILEALGSAIHHVGKPGDAAAVKLAVNTLLCVQIAAMAELISVLRGAGLDAAAAVAAVISTSAAAPAIKGTAAMMLSGDPTPMFPVELALKDLGYFARLAHVPDGRLPLSDAVRAVFSKAVDEGLGPRNITTLVGLYA